MGDLEHVRERAVIRRLYSLATFVPDGPRPAPPSATEAELLFLRLIVREERGPLRTRVAAHLTGLFSFMGAHQTAWLEQMAREVGVTLDENLTRPELLRLIDACQSDLRQTLATPPDDEEVPL